MQKKLLAAFAEKKTQNRLCELWKLKPKKKPRPNPFADAEDIYVTKNKIAVTKTKKTSAKRGYTKTTQTKYYAQNDSNLKQLKAAQGDTVREGRKGNNYKRI